MLLRKLNKKIKKYLEVLITLSKKLKAMFAYDDAVKDGNLLAGQRILRLLVETCDNFFDCDTDWEAQRYLNKRGLFPCHIDKRKFYSYNML